MLYEVSHGPIKYQITTVGSHGGGGRARPHASARAGERKAGERGPAGRLGLAHRSVVGLHGNIATMLHPLVTILPLFTTT